MDYWIARDNDKNKTTYLYDREPIRAQGTKSFLMAGMVRKVTKADNFPVIKVNKKMRVMLARF